VSLVANVLFRCGPTIVESHWGRQVKINGCVADDSEDVVSVLEHIGAIRSGYLLICNTGPDGTAEGYFRFRTPPR
jgi:hypothetical protein